MSNKFTCSSLKLGRRGGIESVVEISRRMILLLNANIKFGTEEITIVHFSEDIE